MPTERHRANFLLTRDPRSLMEEPTSTTAIMPKMAMPASVRMKPARAARKLSPASWPMAGGEDHVSRPEKDGKQGQGDGEELVEVEFFQREEFLFSERSVGVVERLWTLCGVG